MPEVVKILYTDLDGTCVHYEGFEGVSLELGVLNPPSHAC